MIEEREPMVPCAVCGVEHDSDELVMCEMCNVLYCSACESGDEWGCCEDCEDDRRGEKEG